MMNESGDQGSVETDYFYIDQRCEDQTSSRMDGDSEELKRSILGQPL